jgi:hypothetical protein
MRTIFFSFCVAICLASCTTAEFIQHTPTLANTGQHSDKNQFTGRALYSTGNSTTNSVNNGQGPSPYENVSGFQAQGSYSISKSLAIQSSFMHSAEKGGSKEGNNKNIVFNYNRNIIEAGLAWFKPISKEDKFFVELGAGTGFGSSKATEKESILVAGGRYYNHDVFKLYMQPSLYFISKNIHISGGIKFSYIAFNSIETDLTSVERETRSLPPGNSVNTNTLDYFGKAEFFLDKLPSIGLSTQVLFSTDLKKKFDNNQTDNNFGIGICVRLGEIGKKGE